MVVERKWGDNHINKSLKQIDANTWLIGHLVLHRSPSPSDTATWNDNSDNSSYTLTEASNPPPTATTPVNSPYIKLIHEAGDASAVWSIGGNGICKVRYIEEGVTPESKTLNFVNGKQPAFDVPKILHHAFGDDRSYLFIQRLQGRTLDTAWPSLDENWKGHYVNATVNACMEMARWQGPTLGGVDGQYIPEYLLAGADDDFSVLYTSCKALGMDCSGFVFYHADLGPTNIIVEDKPKSGQIGIIDFEISGYFPRGWIRTKFRLSSGMDFSTSASDDPKSWRAEVQKALGVKGFEDFTQAWFDWQRE